MEKVVVKTSPRELGVVAFATAPRLLARAETEEKGSSQHYVA